MNGPNGSSCKIVWKCTTYNESPLNSFTFHGISGQPKYFQTKRRYKWFANTDNIFKKVPATVDSKIMINLSFIMSFVVILRHL